MGISTRSEDGPLDAARIGTMIESFISAQEAEMEADPLGFGRVSMLLPAPAAKAVWALDAIARSKLDVQERLDLEDGSSIVVTSRVGESVMEAMSLAEVLDAARVDRRALGPLPFFRESLADEIVTAKSFEDARSMLGDRVEMLLAQTTDEWFSQERSKVGAWLERDG